MGFADVAAAKMKCLSSTGTYRHTASGGLCRERMQALNTHAILLNKRAQCKHPHYFPPLPRGLTRTQVLTRTPFWFRCVPFFV